jgi:hypothetical protein
MRAKTAIYHACRVCFVLGEEQVPWQYVVHALREGLDLYGDERDPRYKLTEKDLEQYPYLKELLKHLKSIPTPVKEYNHD